jgi:hypothetical protein
VLISRVLDDVLALRDAVQEAASSRAWSQGVTLAREERVVGKSGTEAEIVCEIRVPSRPVPFTVVLYPRDGEWECDCPSKESACSHVAAAAIATAQAREAGQALPTSAKAGGTIRYRLGPEPGGLGVRRTVVRADGKEGPLANVLASDVAATQADIIVDQLLGTRTGTIGADRLGNLLTALADAPDVWLGERKVTTSSEPIVPRATVHDAHGGGARLTLERDPGVDEVVSLGVVRCGDVLHPVGEVELQGARLDRLPASRHFTAGQIGDLLGKVLPAWCRRATRSRRWRPWSTAIRRGRGSTATGWCGSADHCRSATSSPRRSCSGGSATSST